MALLEIDELIFRDERFAALGELTHKGKFDARGRVEALWYDCINKTVEVRTAEEIDNLCGWFDSDLGFFAELMVKARLAERTEGGFRVRGVKERMQWLAEYRGKQKIGKASGGKARVAGAKRDKRGRLLPKSAQQSPCGELETVQQSAGENPAASSTSSHSVPCSLFPVSVKQETKGLAAVADGPPAIVSDKPPKKKKRFTEEHLAKASAFVAAYVRAYQTRWPKGRPEDLNDGKTKGQIMNWIEGYPLGRACELIQAYFQIDTAWFKTKGYDFETFRRNLNPIAQALSSGESVGGIDWSKVRFS